MDCNNCACIGNDFCHIEDGKPNPKKCELMNAVVSLKNAIEILEERGKHVEVVRCKDCWKRHYDNCPFNEFCGYEPEDDFFCGEGEVAQEVQE